MKARCLTVILHWDARYSNVTWPRHCLGEYLVIPNSISRRKLVAKRANMGQIITERRIKKLNVSSVSPFSESVFALFHFPIHTALQFLSNHNYYMASSASGQYAANSVFWLATRAGKMELYCPPGTARFVPANKISPKFKRVHESFLSPKLYSAKVERFFVFSLSLWNQKKCQQEWKQSKQKGWWVLKIRFATKTGKE